MADLLSKPEATLADLLANPAEYFAHFDRDSTTDSSHKVSLQSMAAFASHTVDTIAALRATTQAVDRVYVKGHTAAGDGGGGLFVYLGSGATPGDIDSAGDDDDGFHIVNAGGLIWGRVSALNTAAMWGCFPAETDTLANAASSVHAKLQRCIDYWSDCRTFGGYAFRTNAGATLPVLETIIEDGLYKCTETINVIYSPDSTDPYMESRSPGALSFHGKVFTPSGQDKPAFKVRLLRAGGVNPISLRCMRNRVASEAEWTTYDSPTLWENDTHHRAWSSSLGVHRHEFIKHVMVDGSTMIYRAENTGAVGVTAPTHTTGTAVNGAVTLRAMGTSRNTTGQSMADQVICKYDWGVWVDTISEAPLRVEVQGYMCGLVLCPKELTSSYVGWGRIFADKINNCKVGCVVSSYAAHYTVADQAARLALTGLPIGARVGQNDDATQDFVFNGPLGQESTPGNWSVSGESPWRNAYNWCNENYLYLSDIAPDVGADGDPTHGLWGIVFTSFGWYDVEGSSIYNPPSHNMVIHSSFEVNSVSPLTNGCEAASVVLDHAIENVIHTRTDGTSNVMNIKAVGAVHPRCEPSKNIVYTGRNGSTVNDWANWRLDRSFGAGNVVLEVPFFQRVVSHTVDFSRDLTFSGNNEIRLKNCAYWAYNSTTPSDTVSFVNTKDIDYFGDVNDWQWGLNDCTGVMVDLNHNFDGLAHIEVEPFFSPDMFDDANPPSIRLRIFCFDDKGAHIDISTGYTRNPVREWSTSGTYQFARATSNGMTRAYDTSAKNRRVGFGVEPWVSFVFVGVPGWHLKGYQVSVMNCERARIYNPVTDGTFTDLNDSRVIASAPLRGRYRAPFIAKLADGTTNQFIRLNKADSTEFWATNGEYTVATPPAGEVSWYWQGTQGSANIWEYDGVSAYTQIATGVSYVTSSDWISF